MNVDSGAQLDLLGALQRRLAMIVTAVGGTLLAAYWIAMALPNYYESSATIFIEPQSINQRLVESGADTRNLGFRLSLMTAQILSRNRLSRIIDELELYESESESMLREEVIDLMRTRIIVMPVENEMAEQTSRPNDAPVLNTFVVHFTHKNPKTAADVAQRLANDFVKEHIEERVGTTRKSLEFIQTELKRLDEEYTGIENRIAAVKADNPGRLPEDMVSNQRTLDRTLGELREAYRVLDGARSSKAFWDTQVMAAAALTDPGDDASPMHRLQLLELQLAEYRARGVTSKHPDLLRATQEIQEVRTQIEMGSTEGDNAPMPTVAQQNAEAQRERAALEVEMGAKEVDRLRVAADVIEARIAETPRVAELLNALVQGSKQISTNLRHFADRALRARVQVDVERRQLGEQFRILEAAFPSPTPSSPNRLLIILMGLIIGLALGVGIAVGIEATDSSFRVVRDVQTTLGLPVLAAIPDIVLESDRASQRRKAIRSAVAASVVVIFCLAGGAVTYMYVNGMPGWLGSVIEGEEEAPEADESAARTVEQPVATSAAKAARASSEVQAG
jgi:polysaccharide chain length determinant protein (PEP-CTERM system associated)